MSFINYLREAEKKEKKAKKDTKATKAIDVKTSTPGNSPDVVPGHVTGSVIGLQQPAVDNVKIKDQTVDPNGNVEAYNVMRVFGMNMENNLPGIVLLKSHPTPEVSQAATLLEKDIRAVIEYIMTIQIPL